jgi:hypothetical protein
VRFRLHQAAEHIEAHDHFKRSRRKKNDDK